MTCARLHNYIINWKESNCEDVGETNVTAHSIEDGNSSHDSNDRVRMGPDGNMLYNPTLPEEGFEEIAGTSNIRTYLIEAITSNQMRRPNYNLERNRMRKAQFATNCIDCEYISF